MRTLLLFCVMLFCAMTALGQSVLISNTASLNFGNVAVGSSASLNIVLTDAGNANVSISADSLTGSGFTITGPTLPASLTPNQTATFTVKFSPTATQSYTGSVSFSGTACNSTTQVTLAGTGATASTTTTLFPSSAAPGTPDSGPDNSVELGVTFTADVPGQVLGIRFYKGVGNAGTHVGSLWSSTGTKLASATFTGETASGWQQVTFATPVSITAATPYTASYHAPVGHYADDQFYFGSKGVDNAPLHAPASPNGLYLYSSASTFPTKVWNASNYWVDVVFSPSSAPPPPPPAAHSATISWMASTSTVAGYNAYRGTVSGGPYTRLNGGALISSLSIVDTTVLAGQTYYYVATAVDSSGTESLFSNEVKVVVPSP